MVVVNNNPSPLLFCVFLMFLFPPRAGIAFGEVGKILGAKWKELPEEDRKPYEEQAAKDKERYEKEKAAYQGGGGKEAEAGAEAHEGEGDEEEGENE
jgi:HMG (high mobility group) box